MKTMHCLVCGLLFFTWATFTVQSDPALLGKKVRSIQEEYSIVGLSAVAVKNGAVIWHTHLGMADLERGLPVTGETKFRIASISKIAASVALMQLWEAGKFQLDENISGYLGYPVVHPYFPETPITFRQLLTHTSGLRDGPNYSTFLMATYHAGEGAKALRELIHAEGESYNEGASFSEHEPGTHFQYCNLNFGLMGTLVEKLSGRRFDAYCRKHIFEPLGMAASFNVADLPDIDQLAVLYRPGAEGWNAQFDNHGGVAPENRIGPNYSPGHNAIVFSPQGGLRVSALDLVRLMTPFMRTPPSDAPRVLKPSTIDLMLQEQWSNGRNHEDYRGRGLGFQLTRNVAPGELWAGHGGNAYGLLSKMYFQTAGDIGIIIVTNGSKAGEHAREMYDMERALFDAIREFLAGAPAPAGE